LQGDFAFFDVQNVVNCVVNRGGVVVKVWLETTTNRPAKNMPTFSTLFRFFFKGRHGTDAPPFTEPQNRAKAPDQGSLLKRMVQTLYNSKAMQRRTPLV
jgi:hypothetical protein